jgi:hypothetical protein
LWVVLQQDAEDTEISAALPCAIGGIVLPGEVDISRIVDIHGAEIRRLLLAIALYIHKHKAAVPVFAEPQLVAQ